LPRAGGVKALGCVRGVDLADKRGFSCKVVLVLSDRRERCS
jgi:hypothetical protein